MGKTSSNKTPDIRTSISFSNVTKEVGEGDEKVTFSIKYDSVTERFDLRKNDRLLASSSNLNDCVISAGKNGLHLSDEDKKVSFSDKKLT